MAGLTVVTPPASEPFTRELAKQHLRVDHGDDDAVIDLYLAQARSAVEAHIKCALLPTVYSLKLDGFPAEIVLPVGPVLSATNTISYVDDAGASQTLGSSLYQFSTGEVGLIRPSYGNVWPSTRPQLDAVTVTFTAGWPDTASIPPAIKGALLMILGQLEKQRGNVVIGQSVTEVPLGARNLLLPWVRF